MAARGRPCGRTCVPWTGVFVGIDKAIDVTAPCGVGAHFGVPRTAFLAHFDEAGQVPVESGRLAPPRPPSHVKHGALAAPWRLWVEDSASPPHANGDRTHGAPGTSHKGQYVLQKFVRQIVYGCGDRAWRRMVLVASSREFHRTASRLFRLAWFDVVSVLVIFVRTGGARCQRSDGATNPPRPSFARRAPMCLIPIDAPPSRKRTENGTWQSLRPCTQTRQSKSRQRAPSTRAPPPHRRFRRS